MGFLSSRITFSEFHIPTLYYASFNIRRLNLYCKTKGKNSLNLMNWLDFSIIFRETLKKEFNIASGSNKWF